MSSPELPLLTPQNIASHPRAWKLLEGIKQKLDALFAQSNIPDREFIEVRNLYTEEIDAVEQWILAYVKKTHEDLIGSLKLFVLVKNSLSFSERRRYTKPPVLADPSTKKPTLSPVPLQRIQTPSA